MVARCQVSAPGVAALRPYNCRASSAVCDTITSSLKNEHAIVATLVSYAADHPLEKLREKDGKKN